MAGTKHYRPTDVLLVGPIERDIANEFLMKLRDTHEEAPLAQPIRIVISSDGGDMELGFAIISQINHIKRTGRHVITHCAGGNYSMAAIILQAGSWRTIDSFGYIMTHRPVVSMSDGNWQTDELDEYKKQTDRWCQIMIDTFADRASLPTEDIENIFFVSHHDTYFNAETAKQFNLVDEILA